MKSVLGMIKSDLKTLFLFWSMVICIGVIIIKMVTLVKIV
jgi:hypothetical protein